MDINTPEYDDIIASFEKVLPYLPHMFDDEISVALTDKTKFLLNQCCDSLPLKSEYGDPIPENGAAWESIKTGKVIVREVPKEVYGSPFRSYSVPLKNSCSLRAVYGYSRHSHYE